MKKPWVKYKCGCMEGIWIDTSARCAYDGCRVVAYSDEITIDEPKNWIPCCEDEGKQHLEDQS